MRASNSHRQLKPELSEPRRLLDAGLHLVKLRHHTKQPLGDEWNAAFNRVRKIDEDATGYGMPLASNKMVSIDPDSWTLAVRGMAALGFNLDQIMAAGVRTKSTRPGSGGRSTFAEEPDLSWLRFASRDPQVGTVIEFRASSPNLQDVVPGIVYEAKDGALCTQAYDGTRRLDDLPALPDDLLTWWQRCSTDIDFCREQQARFMAAIGVQPNLAISTGKGSSKLAFDAPGCRGPYNASTTVESILERHGYTWHPKVQRWAPPTATGAPGVRPIPERDGLWQSDHASDPLSGTFDAWVAHVQLDHLGDVEAAKRAWDARKLAVAEQMRGEVDSWMDAVRNYTAPIDCWRSPPPIRWAVEGLIRQGNVGALIAPGATGKTTLLITLGICHALGVPFLGHAVKQGGFLLLSLDDSQEDLDAAVGMVIAAMALDDEQTAEVAAFLRVISLQGKAGPRSFSQPGAPGVRHDAMESALLQACEAVPALVGVCLDTLRQFAGGSTIEDVVIMQASSICAAVAGSTGAYVINPHHTGKAQAREDTGDMYIASGSAAIADNARFVLVLSQVTQRNELARLDAQVQQDQNAGICTVLRLQSRRGSIRHQPKGDVLIARRGYLMELASYAGTGTTARTVEILQAVGILVDSGKTPSKNAIHRLLKGKKERLLAEIDELIECGLVAASSQDGSRESLTPSGLTAAGAALFKSQQGGSQKVVPP